jgi:TPR repeat protein
MCLVCLSISIPAARAAEPDHPVGIEVGKRAFDSEDYTSALEAWRPLAEAGNPLAQLRLGNLLASGLLGKPDRRKANSWWQKSIETWNKLAETGSAEAQFRLANMYSGGRGVRRNREMARGWYEKSAEQGHAQSQYRLGRMLLKERRNRIKKSKNREQLKAPLDRNGPYRWIARAAAQGVPEAIYRVAKLKQYGRHPDGKNLDDAFKLYNRAANAGHISSQYLLALYYEGHWPNLVGKDYQKSREWLAKVANQPLMYVDGGTKSYVRESRLRLAAYHMRGLGVQPDRAIATDWARKAKSYHSVSFLFRSLQNSRLPDSAVANIGCMAAVSRWLDKLIFPCSPERSFKISSADLSNVNVPGRIALGHMLIDANNSRAAREVWRPIAQAGNVEAQYLMGAFYQYAPGWFGSSRKARPWLLKAAERGHAGAQFQLGLILRSGHRIARDRVGSDRWIKKAVDQKLPNALYDAALIAALRNDDFASREAFDLFLRAANAGVSAAQVRIAEFYEGRYPKVIAKDYRKAAEWLSKAANQRFETTPSLIYLFKFVCCRRAQGRARMRLAVYYARGIGVTQNRTTALSWAHRAVNVSDRIDDSIFTKSSDRGKAEELVAIFSDTKLSDNDAGQKSCDLIIGRRSFPAVHPLCQ